MSGCPLCESERTESFLARDQVPANQNLLVASVAEAKKIPRGKLSLYRCLSCGFVFNQAFDLSLLHYGEEYDNTQNSSPAFQKHLDDLVESLIVEHNIRNHLIVEVGCGKGTFLESLIAHPLSHNRGVGFDPSYLGPLSKNGGKLQFQKTYYDENCTHIAPDVIICRHVIEHIAKPVQLLETIKKALGSVPHPRLFFETPCLEWILQNQAVWDFFYEHCSYYTCDSLSLAFERAGFQVDNVRHVFGGQYLWLEASLGPRKQERSASSAVLQLMDRYAHSEALLRKAWSDQIEKRKAQGKIAIWGAGAKGVTFANLFDPERKFFDCIVDLNPKKQNRFLPGTGHPIVSVGELAARNIQTAFLMNPNYLAENERIIKERSLNIQLVAI